MIFRISNACWLPSEMQNVKFDKYRMDSSISQQDHLAATIKAGS